MQRLFDFVLSFIGVLLLSPLFVLVGLWIWLHDGGPVFYFARRAGKDGREFKLVKFRTMIPNADRVGSRITVSGDNRVTAPGALLRKYKVDELPQLLNVLSGDMSLVGPRPEDPRYVAGYSAGHRKVLHYRPGITSPASLEFRNEEKLLAGPDWEQTYVSEILPRKLEIELRYFPVRTIWSDTLLIMRTMASILL